MVVYITGASGWLAHELVSLWNEISWRTEMIPVTRNRTRDSHAQLSIGELANGILSPDDVVVHAGFSRKSDCTELAQSIQTTSQLAQAVSAANASLVNISSQSVYGGVLGDATTENSPISPRYPYALAKSASETVLEAAISQRTGGRYTNVRLAALIGVSGGIMPPNLLTKMIEAAIQRGRIQIVGGDQRFNFLDIHDAATAILRLLELHPAQWARNYNVGPGNQTSIHDAANTVKGAAKRRLSHLNLQIETVAGDETGLNVGMDCSRFRSDTGWTPTYALEDSVDEMIGFYLRSNEVRG